jgi:hypothetical protein
MKLSPFEVRWATCALGAIFPGSNEDGLAGIAGMDVGGYLAEVMRSLPYRPALGLRLAIWLVACAPVFVIGRVATIAQLCQADRERVIATLLASSSYGLRSLVMLLKTFGAMLYAGDERVRARFHRAVPRAIVPLRIRRGRTV